MALQLDLFQSAGVGVGALLLGMLFTRHIPFLKRFCIPAPVSGGLLVSLLTLLLYALGVECTFDGSVKDLCMMLFFTSVGFQSDMKALKQGGKPLLVMIGLVAVLIAAQNLISVGIARGLGLSPLFGMAAGSIPMSGGHGTLLGGPLGESLIRRHHLAKPSGQTSVMTGIEATEAAPAARETASLSEESAFREMLIAACELFIAMALGTGVSKLLASTGITFPTYFGSLIAACLMRNLLGLSPRIASRMCLGRIVSIGDICLQLFLGMAMASLRLWELASLALPLCLILVAQVTFMALYGAFVAFPLLGKSYDGAVLVSGLCGFGLGATPNAMANMSAVCYKYRYTVNPFIIVPIIGAMFVDLINTGIITLFLNLI